MRNRFVLATLALLCAFTPVSGDDTGKNEQARQMFESLFTPPGQLPVQDLVAEGEELEAEGAGGHLVPAAKAKYYFKAPAYLRFDRVNVNPKQPFLGLLKVIVRDGDSYHIFLTHNYPTKSGIDPQVAPDSLPFSLTRYKKDASREFYYLGSEAWKETTVHRVQILNPADPNWTCVVWIDHQKRVPVQAEYTAAPEKPGGKPSKKRVVWSDVRQLPDGRYFPYQAQIFIDEKLREMRVYKGVRINVGLDNSLFRLIPELEPNH